MSKHLDPKSWALEWVERFWHQRDPRAMEDLMHPDCTFTEMAGGSWVATGYAPLRRNAELFLTAVPDFHLRFCQLVGDETWFAWAVHCTGTVSDQTFGAELLGKPFNMASLTCGQVRDGRIIEAYNYVSFNQPKVLLPGWQHAPFRDPPGSSAECTPEASSEIMRAYVEGVWSGRSGAALDRILAPDAVITEANAWGYETRGIAAIRRNSEWFQEHIPTPELRILRMISEPAAAAVMFELNGRVAGDAFGRVARGSVATIRGMVIGTVSDGRLVHAYSHLDFNHIGMELPAP